MLMDANQLSRFKLRCRRGMKELDFVLDRYLARNLPVADEQEIALFDELLELQDPELFAILFETIETPAHFQLLAEKIRQI